MFTSILIYSLQTAPFRCEDLAERAEKDLKGHCSAVKGVLGPIRQGACFKSGDDGGYVEYFSIEYTASCESREHET